MADGFLLHKSNKATTVGLFRSSGKRPLNNNALSFFLSVCQEVFVLRWPPFGGQVGRRCCAVRRSPIVATCSARLANKIIPPGLLRVLYTPYGKLPPARGVASGASSETRFTLKALSPFSHSKFEKLSVFKPGSPCTALSGGKAPRRPPINPIPLVAIGRGRSFEKQLRYMFLCNALLKHVIKNSTARLRIRMQGPRHPVDAACPCRDQRAAPGEVG